MDTLLPVPVAPDLIVYLSGALIVSVMIWLVATTKWLGTSNEHYQKSLLHHQKRRAAEMGSSSKNKAFDSDQYVHNHMAEFHKRLIMKSGGKQHESSGELESSLQEGGRMSPADIEDLLNGLRLSHIEESKRWIIVAYQKKKMH